MHDISDLVRAHFQALFILVKKDMHLSIALATYNGEMYIYDLLESIREQLRLPDELVIYDDCSTDATVNIVRKFAATVTFPVHIFINEKNVGFRQNFYNAISACSFELIALCDQDDIWQPEKISGCLRVFEENSVDAVVHGYTVVDKDLKYLRFIRPAKKSTIQEPYEGSYLNCYVGFSVVFRADLLKGFDYLSRPVDPNFPKYQMAHDQWIALILFSKGRTYILPKSLVMYRQHEKNSIGFNIEGNRWRTQRILDFNIDRLRFLIRHIKYIKIYLKDALCKDHQKSASDLYWNAVLKNHYRRYVVYKSKALKDILCNLLWASYVGTYRSVRFGGFGALAFFKDAVNIFVGKVRGKSY
jgi:glycosyltransferase involved in cell wall biosynthesis